MGENEPVEQLARDAAAGDLDALESLLTELDRGGYIRVPLRGLITDPQTIDDLAHDILITVAEKITTFDQRARFTTWLHRIARNRAIDTLRKHRPHTPLDDTTTTTEQQRISSLIADHNDVRTALHELPEDYRHPVILRDIDQLDYEEISARLNLNPATVRTRVSRGRAMLAARLGRVV